VGALEALRSASSQGGEPSKKLFSAAARACGQGRRWDLALGLLRHMQLHGPELDVIMCGAVIGTAELALAPLVCVHRSIASA